MHMLDAETIIELPAVIEPVSQVRSTLIQSSLKQLRASGHFDAYERRLPREKRAAVLETLGPTWLSIDIALAHYKACDELQLSTSELLKIGEGVGSRMSSTLISTLTRVAKLSGITPWQFYGQLERFWKRAFIGGAVSLKRLGPTESLIEVRGVALCRYAYFRHGFTGVINAIAKLAADDSTTTVVEHAPDMILMRGFWTRGHGPKLSERDQQR